MLSSSKPRTEARGAPNATVLQQIAALRRDPRVIEALQGNDGVDMDSERPENTSTCQMLTTQDFVDEPVLLERMQQALTGVGLDCAIMHYRPQSRSVLVFNRCFGIKLKTEKMGLLDVFSAFVPAPPTDADFDVAFPTGTLDFFDDYSPVRTVDASTDDDAEVASATSSDTTIQLPAVFKERAVALYDGRTCELMRAGGPTFMWRALAYEGDGRLPAGIVCLEGYKMTIVKIGGKTKKKMNKKTHKNKLIDEPDIAKVRDAVADVVAQARRLAAETPVALELPELEALMGATASIANITANDISTPNAEPSFNDDGAGRRALLQVNEQYGPLGSAMDVRGDGE